MLITGTETQSELAKKCSCGSIIEKGIKVNQECIIAELVHDCSSNGNGSEDDCKKICLDDLLIPIDGCFMLDKKIPSKGIFVLNDSLCQYKFLAAYAKDNKQLYWRILDPLDDNLETINYDFNIEITTSDLAADKVDITINITLTPDDTNYVATWDGIGTIYINGEPFTQWTGTDLSWFSVGSANIMNRLDFPDIEGQITDTVLRNDDGDIPTSTLSGNIKSSDGKLNYYVEIEFAYDFSTTTLTYSIKKVELQLNEFLDPEVVIQTVDIPAKKANGTFTIPGSGFVDVGFTGSDEFEINGETFTEGSEFATGADDAETAQNLVDAINANININTLVVATHDYTAGTNGGGVITIEALTAGEDGNAVTIAVTVGNATASGSTLTGGADAVPFATDNIDGNNEATIIIDGKFKTIDAKRYRSMDSLLVLSSLEEMKLGDIEFYNDSTDEIKLKILAAL